MAELASPGNERLKLLRLRLKRGWMDEGQLSDDESEEGAEDVSRDVVLR